MSGAVRASRISCPVRGPAVPPRSLADSRPSSAVRGEGGLSSRAAPPQHRGSAPRTAVPTALLLGQWEHELLLALDDGGDCSAYSLLELLSSDAGGVLTRSAEDEICESSVGSPEPALRAARPSPALGLANSSCLDLSSPQLCRLNVETPGSVQVPGGCACPGNPLSAASRENRRTGPGGSPQGRRSGATVCRCLKTTVSYRLFTVFVV